MQELDGKKLLFVTERHGVRTAAGRTRSGSSGLVEVNGGLKEGERYAVQRRLRVEVRAKKGEWRAITTMLEKSISIR